MLTVRASSVAGCVITTAVIARGGLSGVFGAFYGYILTATINTSKGIEVCTGTMAKSLA